MKVWRSLLFTLCSLALIALACNMMNKKETSISINAYLNITSMKVQPQEGSGSFTAFMTGQANHKPDNLRCYISAEGGEVEVFNQEQPSAPAGEKEWSKTFPFTFTAPGTHTLVCIGEQLPSIRRVDFTVTASTENATSNGKPGEYTHATIRFTSPSSWVNTTGGEFTIPPWCLPGSDQSEGNDDPPLSIFSNGSMESICKGQMMGSVNQIWQGTTVGQLDLQTGKVTWTLTMEIHRLNEPGDTTHFATMKVQVTSQPGTIEIQPDGSATAAGSADWIYQCSVPGSFNDGYPQCGPYQNAPDQPTSFNEAGTLEWTMVLAP